MKIVVVEDEVRIREGIQTLLDMLDDNYEFAGEAENGKLGLELIQKVHPDLVITDIRMPDMDGLTMLETIKSAGEKAKAIVVSAYSEFEYARTAMKLGVTEYLLKPISVDEFSKALNNVKIQMEKEASMQPEAVGTIEQVIGGILYGQIKLDESIRSYLYTRYEVDESKNCIEICVYMGNNYKSSAEKVQHVWKNLLEERGDLKFCIVRADYEQSLLIFIYQYDNAKDVERRIQCWMLQNQKEDRNFENIGWILVDKLDSLKECFETIYNYMDWNIALGSGVMISYPKITQVRTEVCSYPMNLENSLKTELCTGNMSRVEKTVSAFHRYFSGEKVYNPKDIKECYVRFMWAVINISKEIDMLDYQQLNQQALLDRIMNSRTQKELEEATCELMGKIQIKNADEDISHLTVKRVKSMVHEYYQSGITLEEIAQKLDITPEYLSTQFHKVVGETFSNYVKNYRMGKAKELLLGTQLKLYEVAEQVGYSDGKYFSRVFKECTGYLPAEYRKTHK